MWPREIWLEALWQDPTVDPYEIAVSRAFARYAGKGDVTWCSYDELSRRSGGTSERKLRASVQSLQRKGYLVVAERARQHHSTRYRLTIPSGEVLSAGALVAPAEERSVDA